MTATILWAFAGVLAWFAVAVTFGIILGKGIAAGRSHGEG